MSFCCTTSSTSPPSPPPAQVPPYDPAWKPQGCMQTLQAPGLVTAQMVEAVGMGQWIYPFRKLWNQYVSENNHRADVYEAFVGACEQCSHKCPQTAKDLLADLVSYSNIDDRAFGKLSVLANEVQDEASAKKLFQKSLGTPRRSVFYHALLKLATETLPQVDMHFAQQICDEMTKHGIPYTPPAIRFLLHGCSRLYPVCLDLAFGIMDFRIRVDHDVEPCLLHQFFSVLELTKGEDARRATQYLRQLNPSFILQTITEVAPELPRSDRCGCEQCPCVNTYYIAHATSIPLDDDFTAPPNSYVCFLYSSIRFLCERLYCMGKDHPTRLRAERIRHLLSTCPQCVVIPLEKELSVRINDTEPSPVQNTPHTKVFHFLRGVRNCCAAQCECIFVCADAPVVAQATQQGFQCIPTVPRTAAATTKPADKTGPPLPHSSHA